MVEGQAFQGRDRRETRQYVGSTRANGDEPARGAQLAAASLVASVGRLRNSRMRGSDDRAEVKNLLQNRRPCCRN
jgi:hypothetical protein